nr:MAG TPA: hypothetical protein [Bacteriophage sp.]
MCSWKFYCIRITFLCKLIYLRSSRISQSYCPCNLVKCFSCRIISCSSNYFILAIVIDLNKVCMSSRNNKRNKRRFEFFILNIVGTNMTFYVMYPY